MRVVLDPNVLVSATIAPVGGPGQVVLAAFAGPFSLVVCPQMLGELHTVLRRPAFRRYLDLDEVGEYVSDIAGVVDDVSDPADVQPVSRDPDDDYLIALAVQSGAERLVTGDADLLEVAAKLPIRIVSPRQFLDEL